MLRKGATPKTVRNLITFLHSIFALAVQVGPKHQPVGADVHGAGASRRRRSTRTMRRLRRKLSKSTRRSVRSQSCGAAALGWTPEHVGTLDALPFVSTEAPESCGVSGGRCAAPDAVIDNGNGSDVGHMRADACCEYIDRPAPRRRRATQQGKQGERGGQQRPAERHTCPRLRNEAPQRSVPEAKGGPVTPAQHQSEFVILALCHVRQVHDRRDDLARYERVVVIKRLKNPRPQSSLCSVCERQRHRPGGTGNHAPQRPGNRHVAINPRRSCERIIPFG